METPVRPRLTVVIASVAVAGIGVGGCGNGDQAKQALTAAHARIVREQAAARAQIARERQAALQKTQRELRREKRSLSSLRHQISVERQRRTDARAEAKSAERTLTRLQAEVSGTRAAIRRGTIHGDGIYLVGRDIEPGMYRSAGGTDNCYWARLSTLNTSDIIDNDNTTGPVVIQVAPTDKALQLSGCATFHKIG